MLVMDAMDVHSEKLPQDGTRAAPIALSRTANCHILHQSFEYDIICNIIVYDNIIWLKTPLETAIYNIIYDIIVLV